MSTRAGTRITVLQFCLLFGMGVVLARAAQLQLIEGRQLGRQAAQRRTEHRMLEARRGAIYDRRGQPLAITQEFYHAGVAPNEVESRSRFVRSVSRALGVSANELDRKMRSKRYVYFHGPFTASQLEPVRGMKGLHLESSYARAYPARRLAGPVIGRLNADSGGGASGLELALDSLLSGVPGEAVLLRDRFGQRYESPARRVRDPVAGNDIWLTLDAELQDIAERTLEDAIGDFKAKGGDIVFLEPRTGEILAVASRQIQNGETLARPTAFTDPFEPGSTAKLFTAAALLKLKRVDSTDRVSGEGGRWAMPIRNHSPRVIEDVHRVDGQLTLADAIKVSSNIAMAKFSARLSPREQFEILRDFGFGSPTGVEFPSESRGELRAPERWLLDYSRASHAMGYEFSVTALQLASAYAAIANDGVLVTPSLVREIRAPDGDLLYRHQPEPVRRAVSSELATKLRGYLRAVVSEGGTGERARLANFDLVGKTGTAQLLRNGRYQELYVASFAALFPADDPQLVIVVKLSELEGSVIYGGQTAAPVTRSMLEQALASRRIALDRQRLMPATTTSLPDVRDTLSDAPVPVQVVRWPLDQSDSAKEANVTVPLVKGRSIREAALALHQRGLRVSVHGKGTVVRSEPSAGDAARPGQLVTLWTTE